MTSIEDFDTAIERLRKEGKQDRAVIRAHELQRMVELLERAGFTFLSWV